MIERLEMWVLFQEQTTPCIVLWVTMVKYVRRALKQKLDKGMFIVHSRGERGT